MTFAAVLAILFLVGSIAIHVGSMVLVAVWVRRESLRRAATATAGRIVIARPICGLDENIARSLRDGFMLSYPDYELVFCAHAADDPAVPFVVKLIGEHPHVKATILIGDEPISANPKLNNMAQSWSRATSDWVVFCDDNVLLPRDYVQQLLAARLPTTGLVSSIHLGAEPRGWWAEVECAFLNGFQARWWLAAAVSGHAFASGKTMMVCRRDVENAGGIEALASELAEDAALTKIMRRAGRGIAVLPRPLLQPLGVRPASEVLGRQTRWARLRRSSFPLQFIPECFAGCVFPAAAAAGIAVWAGSSAAVAVSALLFVWYAAELVFLRWMGWPMTAATVPASMFRDVALPYVWLTAWRSGRGRTWRGRVVYRPTKPE